MGGRNLLYLLYSIAAHVALLGLFAVSLNLSPRLQGAGQGEEAIQAIAVEESEVEAAVAALEAEREAQERERQEALAQLEAERQAEQERLQALREEQARLEAQREAEREAAREAEARAEREREAAEQARQEREAAEQARREAEEQARREAEEQARREAEEQARREAEEQARREAEEQARREAEERARREREQALREEMQREAEAREQAARERRLAQTRSQYDAAIRDKVRRNWTRPAGTPDGLSCVVEVRLGPGGTVMEVNVVESSGNAAFDRSAETAVLRADPLPMPEEPELAAPYRRGVRFEFRPDD